MSRDRRAISFSEIPVQIEKASRFSDEDHFFSPHELISMLKGQPRILRRLVAATTISHDAGPDRRPGSWGLAFLAYLLDGTASQKKWWSNHSRDRAYWELLGFDGWIPDWRTVYDRFDELKELQTGDVGGEPVTVLAELAVALIQAARRRDPRVGAWVHLDGTEVEAHVRAVHDCQAGDACPGSRGKGGAPQALGRTPTESASSHRQEVANGPADTTGEGVEAEGLTTLPIERRVADIKRGGVRIFVGGHWFWVRDPDAGIRTYRPKHGAPKSWIGYLGVIATDHFTGGALLPDVFRADQNESDLFPDVVARLQRVLDGSPTWLSADRGPATRANYEVCTRAEIGFVAPYRRENGSAPLHMPEGPAGEHGPRWDDQGAPRCAHCGGPTRHRGFDSAKGKPRIRYECELKPYAECEPVKKLSCSKDWRALLPHPRTSDAYVAMAIGHSPSERTHGAQRARYGVLGKSLAGRSHKIGLAWQRLRAAAAWFIEWLWLSRRVGWLDGHAGTTAKILAPTAERLKDAKTKHQERLTRLRAEERQRLERKTEQRAARAAKKRGTKAKAPPPQG